MVIPNGILNNPALGYVRQWILAHTQVLAVVDMARDLFQPKNDTQTSMVLMRRLMPEEEDLAGRQALDYPTFFAIAEKIGHDKRGNATYRRWPDGTEVIVARKETETDVDPVTGLQTKREMEIRDRLIDDELPEVARSYLTWLQAQR
jgi:type I restriction enzyme M protein